MPSELQVRVGTYRRVTATARWFAPDLLRLPRQERGLAELTHARTPRQRTFAWLTAHRRLARDYERHPSVSEAMIRWAAINTITRRMARGGPATRQQRRTFPAIS
jgi:transposase